MRSSQQRLAYFPRTQRSQSRRLVPINACPTQRARANLPADTADALERPRTMRVAVTLAVSEGLPLSKFERKHDYFTPEEWDDHERVKERWSNPGRAREAIVYPA